MSVIPFILDGPDQTVVCTEEEFHRSGHRKGTKILIEDIDKEQIPILKDADSDNANVSYDLTVGDQYLNLADNSTRGIDEKHPIYLPPGAAVIIRTAEFVHFPVTRFGNILPKVSMLHQGLSNTSSKVDPGYKGHLSITVFNLGKRTIEIKHKKPFCTLYILEIGKGARPYKKVSKGLPVFPPEEKLKARIISGLKKYNWLITTAIATAALIVSIFKK